MLKLFTEPSTCDHSVDVSNAAIFVEHIDNFIETDEIVKSDTGALNNFSCLTAAASTPPNGHVAWHEKIHHLGKNVGQIFVVYASFADLRSSFYTLEQRYPKEILAQAPGRGAESQ